MHREVLESARYPDAVFTPDHVGGELPPSGKSQLQIHGAFQIHGATHEMMFHFAAGIQSSEVTTSTAFVIPNVQWGMKNPGRFLLKVSDKVEITVQATGRVQ
jgi:hypothetical protein